MCQNMQVPSPETLLGFCGQSGVRLEPSDALPCLNRINFSQGADNPLDTVKFYDSWADTESRCGSSLGCITMHVHVCV